MIFKSNSIHEHWPSIVQRLEEAHTLAGDNIQLAQQNMKEIFELSVPDTKFMVGD